MQEDRFYVYVLLDPRKPGNFKYEEFSFDYEPFYIGKGTRRRMYANLQPNQLQVDSYRTNKIKRILETGERPIVVKIVTGLSELEAYEIEASCIESIGLYRDGGVLTNIEEGRRDGHKPPMSDESRKKLSRALKGRVITPEWRKRISVNNVRYWTGKHITEAMKDSFREWRKTQDMSSWWKSYRLTDPDGNVFTVSNGLEKFCTEHGLNRTHLVSVASGKRRHHKNWTCVRLSENTESN